MGILGGLLKEITSPITDLVSEIVVDKDKKNELNFKVQELIDKADQRYHEQLMGQIAVNVEEAKHPSVLVAGWRPFIGWTCGAGIAYTFIISPITLQIARFFDYSGEMVVIDTASLMTLVLAMLGVSASRSYDKKNNVDTKRTS